MQRERVSENVYWFQSEIYAQVTAGAIIGSQWAVVIDTLAMPGEAEEIRDFITEELGLPIRYLINTHSHSDHAWGNCFFPGATVISHEKCAKFLREKGIPSLEATKEKNKAFQNSRIVIPQLTFATGEMTLRVGKKNLSLMPTPGHSDDGISVFIEEDRILFCGDAFMPIPYIVDGNVDESIRVMEKFGNMGLENIIQGHGDIVLRGEIDEAVQENISYLKAIKEIAQKCRVKRDPVSYLESINIESCGKSRVNLGGLAETLHKRNLVCLYKKVLAEQGVPDEDEYDDDIDEDDFDDLAFSDDENMSSLNAIDDEFDEDQDFDDEEDEEECDDDDLF